VKLLGLILSRFDKTLAKTITILLQTLIAVYSDRMARSVKRQTSLGALLHDTFAMLIKKHVNKLLFIRYGQY